MAGEQRTAPSSSCAIQLIASRSVSLSVFCAGTPSSGRTAHDCPAQCTCPPPSAASRPHLWNRGEAIGWPQSSTGTSRFMRARNCRRSVRHKVATGVNRTTDPQNSTYIFQFFPIENVSRRRQIGTSRTCSKVNSRSVVSDLSLLDRRPLCPRLNKHRRMSDVTVNGGSLTCHVEGVSQTVFLAVSAE